ncbi:MAG: hypothetical protein GX131_12835 [candidate division WS1 bacterium]|jgi:hypothetical protein|nr:hypothetical protein [candidate division WS1 bacterium]
MRHAQNVGLNALDSMIDGLVNYLVRVQEDEGEYAGSFWSELAYHIPLLDYRAGGSHHNRTVGSAGLAFVKLNDDYPERNLLRRAERAFDWVITRQHEDGGLFEITNNDRPSQFHLDFERSSISLGLVTHGTYSALQLGLPDKPSWLHFLRQAARWQMTVETDPGNFLHTEGYPEDKLILNGSAHAAETLLIGAEVSDDEAERQYFVAGAGRAIEAIMRLQRDNGMLPYSNYENDNSISYTATVAWVLQNLLDMNPMPTGLVDDVSGTLDRAAEFLADQVRDDGSVDWDTWENHGQKYHTWVYGLMARALAWHREPKYIDAAERLVISAHERLYSPEQGLCRMYDFPLGEERVICGHSIRAEGFYECAYHQADLFDCLVDVRQLLRQQAQ